MTTNEMNNQYDDLKKIGVLFCGGCNPVYDRELLYRQLKQHYEASVIFEFYSESDEYDLLLIINGCSSECLINQVHPASIVCLDSGDVKKAIRKIDNMLISL
jgi:hypothetical protein